MITFFYALATLMAWKIRLPALSNVLEIKFTAKKRIVPTNQCRWRFSEIFDTVKYKIIDAYHEFHIQQTQY